MRSKAGRAQQGRPSRSGAELQAPAPAVHSAGRQQAGQAGHSNTAQQRSHGMPGREIGSAGAHACPAAPSPLPGATTTEKKEQQLQAAHVGGAFGGGPRQWGCHAAKVPAIVGKEVGVIWHEGEGAAGRHPRGRRSGGSAARRAADPPRKVGLCQVHPCRHRQPLSGGISKHHVWMLATRNASAGQAWLRPRRVTCRKLRWSTTPGGDPCSSAAPAHLAGRSAAPPSAAPCFRL